MALIDDIPILKPFYYNIISKTSNILSELSITLRKKYHQKLEDHQKDVIRDFCDALIEAKEEAINEEKESSAHLNDVNLSLVIINLFFGKFSKYEYLSEYKISLFVKLINNKLEVTPLSI